MAHELKIKPEFFYDIVYCDKRFEIRKNDRGFCVGEKMILREYDKGHYTGSVIVAVIDYVSPLGCIGVRKGYVVLSITVISVKEMV